MYVHVCESLVFPHIHHIRTYITAQMYIHTYVCTFVQFHKFLHYHDSTVLYCMYCRYAHTGMVDCSNTYPVLAPDAGLHRGVRPHGQDLEVGRQ